MNISDRVSDSSEGELLENEKKQMLKGLLICQAVAPLLYMNLGAFFPAYAYSNYGLSEMDIGIIFSLYQVAFILTAIWCAYNLQKVGRRKALQSALILMSIATLVFGIASEIEETWNFYTVCCMARLVQGTAAGIVEVTVPAIISQ